MSLLGSIFTAARGDWHWISANPLQDVRRPAAPAARARTLSKPEVYAMLPALGYRPGKRPARTKQMVAYAMLIALRTGMRAGEVVGMQWARVHGARVPVLADNLSGFGWMIGAFLGGLFHWIAMRGRIVIDAAAETAPHAAQRPA